MPEGIANQDIDTPTMVNTGGASDARRARGELTSRTSSRGANGKPIAGAQYNRHGRPSTTERITAKGAPGGGGGEGVEKSLLPLAKVSASAVAAQRWQTEIKQQKVW